MNKEKLYPVVSYLFILTFGMASRISQPREISASSYYDLFVTVPPVEIEEGTFAEERSVLAPQGEVVLSAVEDTTLAHINKIYGLPSSYVPTNLTQITSVPTFGTQRLRAGILPYLYQLFGAAQEAGYELAVASAYRSYAEQELVFLWWVEQVGWEAALRGSALPGHSEHQLGTTVDLALAENVNFERFVSSPAAPWVAKNAHRFGFVVSYPPGKESITGYISEPWHVRWVGIDLATQLFNQGLTLEEYLSR
ncbi:D-alanyl-D-alanine carboxypeptidase family protein [Candidatus Saccharibacteria bacterium]|nr:D-alanyl-D-alanine carboxypeptidase family protein [Candidatus Saccharibacteria bacterium]